MFCTYKHAWTKCTEYTNTHLFLNYCYYYYQLDIKSSLTKISAVWQSTASMAVVIGFNHGLPWCVKYMARGPPVTTKPDGEAGGFCGDRRPEGHVFHTSRQAMIKTYYSTSIRKTMVQNCSYFTQMKSTTTAIDDSNRRRNKLGLGCSREATAPLILIFKLLFLWLNIGRHFKGITQFHNCHSPKHTSKIYYPVINIFREICTKIIT